MEEFFAARDKVAALRKNLQKEERKLAELSQTIPLESVLSLLDTKLMNTLKRNGIITVGQLLDPAIRVDKLPDIGRKGVTDIREVLKVNNLYIPSNR